MRATLEITDTDDGRVDLRVVLSEPVDPETQPMDSLPRSFRLVIEILEALVNDPTSTMDTITLTDPEGNQRDAYRRGPQG
jgi:hypothetical protein